MFRQSPSRNHRSKGFRIKRALQIFMLLAICFWLLYQVKHSHDKKKAFDERSIKLENEHGITKLGRKDLHPRLEEKASENEIHDREEVTEGDEQENKPEEEEENKPDEEEEDENKAERGKSKEDEEKDKDEEEEKSKEDAEEENKDDEEEEDEEKSKDEVVEDKNKDEEDKINHEGEEVAEEDESKTEENEEEGRGAGDDEIDEQDQERAEEEAQRGEDFLDEEEKGEKEDNEEKAEQSENDRNTQEAREENYKGDDASSAVVRETQIVTTEAESGTSRNLTEEELVENGENNKLGLDKTNITESRTLEQINPEVVVGENFEDNTSVNVNNNEETETDQTHMNSTRTKSNTLPEVNNSSGTENVHTPSSFLQKGTHISSYARTNQTPKLEISDGGESKLQTVTQDENSNVTAGKEQSDSNSALSTTTENADVAKVEFSDTSNNAKTGTLEEHAGKSSSTAGELNNSSSLVTNEDTYGTQSEKAVTTEGAVEPDHSKASSITNESADMIQSATNDSDIDKIPHKEKEARTYLGTLPETETEGMNKENVAVK